MAPNVSAPEARSSVHGARIEITYSENNVVQQTDGEFIAVSDDSLYCLNHRRLMAISLHTVSRAKITVYDANHGRLAAWTLLGTLSTASHGMVAAATAPLWILVGSITTAMRSHEPVSTELGEWRQLSKYARYPAGLPDSLAHDGLWMEASPAR